MGPGSRTVGATYERLNDGQVDLQPMAAGENNLFNQEDSEESWVCVVSWADAAASLRHLANALVSRPHPAAAAPEHSTASSRQQQQLYPGSQQQQQQPHPGSQQQHPEGRQQQQQAAAAVVPVPVAPPRPTAHALLAALDSAEAAYALEEAGLLTERQNPASGQQQRRNRASVQQHPGSQQRRRSRGKGQEQDTVITLLGNGRVARALALRARRAIAMLEQGPLQELRSMPTANAIAMETAVASQMLLAGYQLRAATCLRDFAAGCEQEMQEWRLAVSWFFPIAD